MTRQGWHRLLEGAPWFRGEGGFPIAAYSEFMPPPRLGPKPYDGCGPCEPLDPQDPFGWLVTEYEEAMELQPGMARLASHLVLTFEHLAHGRPAHGIAQNKLDGNPYWPAELASRTAPPRQERFVMLLPLALSRTQDDKGRVRWTLFGGSEQGPDRAFWKSFYEAPGREIAADVALDFFRRLLQAAYGETREQLADLRRTGFRILPRTAGLDVPYWQQAPLPSWTEEFLLGVREPIARVKYLLTFEPFAALPAKVREAYLAGSLHLLPFPGSLVFWGARPFLALREELPLAMQAPLAQCLDRCEAVHGIRITQSGNLHEPGFGNHPEHTAMGQLRNTYLRTHRWARLHRHEDELAVSAEEDKLAHVLLSAAPDDLGLYGKPMARNVQIWTHEYRLLLDGPRAGRKELTHAAVALREGGSFGYRFVFPAMRIGRHEFYWHRPLVAFKAKDGAAELVEPAPRGYLTAYPADRPDPARPIEFWPRLLERKPQMAAVHTVHIEHEHYRYLTTINIRKLLEASEWAGRRPLPRSFARQLLTLPKDCSLDRWLWGLECAAGDPLAGRELVKELGCRIEPEATAPGLAGASLPEPLTFHRTARRAFEVKYWRTIAALAEGRWRNKDNADCVRDPATMRHLRHHQRDLDALGDYLLAYYRRSIARMGMEGRAVAGELPFLWRTDFEFDWSDGWLGNQQARLRERDLVVVIPGRDRRRAIVMADHYDTAYMEDIYEKARGGSGARIAAAGADDNHSATAALMLAAPIFMELSKAGRLHRDVWLVHLTGEEFPSDCMGARHLAQRLVERTLKLTAPGRRAVDLSQVHVDGVYVLDMIAHNTSRDLDVFQLAPGTCPQSLELAYHAHQANAMWNAGSIDWNRRPDRATAGRSQRSAEGKMIPPVAKHPHLFGEIRPYYSPHSTLFNTDGQIFSDAGVPVVLFMENYDINRQGYHDTHDTMANIDLDYGSAVAAIAIESVAQAAAATRRLFGAGNHGAHAE